MPTKTELLERIAEIKLDARGQGVPCGNGWIPRSKKCSRDKARTTNKGAIKRGVEKAREYNVLRAEVKRDIGKKAVVKKSTVPSQGGSAKPQSITWDMAYNTPWLMTASQYQAVKGVKQPWIAEISPHQMGLMSNRQKKQYAEQRSKEWQASGSAKEEWADKVYQAYKEGKFTDADVAHIKAFGMIDTSPSMAISLRKRAEEKAERDRLISKASEENKINSVDEMEIGDRIYDPITRRYGTVTRKFAKSARVLSDDGTEGKLDIGVRTQWRDRNDLERAALSGEKIRPPKPEFTDIKPVKQTKSTKVKTVNFNELYGEKIGDTTPLMRNAKSSMKELGFFGPSVDRLYALKTAIANSENPGQYEILRFAVRKGENSYTAVKNTDRKDTLRERLDSLHERYDRQVCTAGKSQPCGDVCIPFRRNGKPIKCGDKEKSRLGFKVRSRLQRFKEGRSAKQQQLYKQYAQQKAEGANLKAKQRVEHRAARNAADYRANRQAQRSAARQTERQAREQADYRAKREQQRNAAKETERQAREYAQSRTKQKPKVDPWASQDYSTRRGVNAGYNESADKELLGVGDVDARSLSKAYRAAARKYHPDLGGKKEQMQRVNQAYENLKKKYKLDSRLDSAIAPESGMYWVRMG